MAAVAVAAIASVAIYSLTRTVQVPGQRLGEIAQQTAKEGEPRLIIYGIVRPIGGNLVAVQEPPRVERRKQKSGGKGGGGGSSTTIEVPRRTYAIGICEGPVTGIRRAWRNNKLVYDGRGTAWGRRNNGTFLQRFRFYLGDWDQMPDPSLEAVFGVGTVPAMRGTCYMVARDEDLQDTGGAVPQWIFEVERAYGYALTSKPYPVEEIQELDSSDASLTRISSPLVQSNMEPEYLDSDAAATAMDFRSLLAKYAYQEDLDSSHTLEAMQHRAVLVPYDSGVESLDSDQALEAINHRIALITYPNYETESLNSDQTLEAINHANP